MTMLPEACASELGISFMYISGQEMLGKRTELIEAFDLAAQEAPLVLYLSDLDWLAPRAGASYEWGPGNQRGRPPTFADKSLTAALIAVLDRLQTNRDVLLIGGCYRIDVVDQAVIKEKTRFNRKVFLSPPSAKERREILAIYAGRTATAGPLDLEAIARDTECFVGWDLENLVKRAALIALRDGRAALTQLDLEQAIGAVRPWLTPDMIEGYRRLYQADCPHHYHF
jgi:transitional endoplasmic reticulum ATPase